MRGNPIFHDLDTHINSMVCDDGLFLKWMEQRSQEDFGGEGLPAFWSHPTIHAITSALNDDDEHRAYLFALRTTSWAEALTEDEEDPQRHAIAALWIAIMVFSIGSVRDAMKADVRDIARAWWEQNVPLIKGMLQ